MTKNNQKKSKDEKKDPPKNGHKDDELNKQTSSSSLSTSHILFGIVVAFTAYCLSPQVISFFSSSDVSRRLMTQVSEPKDDPCSTELLLAQFLHDEPVPGMDLVCLRPNWHLGLWPGAVNKSGLPIEIGLENDQPDWKEFKGTLEKTLDLPNRSPVVQPWALFSQDGKRIADEETVSGEGDDVVIMTKITNAQLLLVMHGGQWVWPGVRIGFKRTVDISHLPGLEDVRLPTRNATLETLSLFPLVVSVKGFLEDDECEHVREKAKPNIRYSGVSLMDKDKGRPASDFRTSQSCFLSPNRDEILHAIDLRTASLVRIPADHQEHTQILRYGLTEHYDAHHDYFDPRFYQKDPNTLRVTENGKKNRMATVFWYLTTVEKGGETIFPRFNKGPVPHSYKDCSKGLKVKPEQGKVIIFYSLLPSGDFDPLSLHGACPVEEGVKWAGNKWVWNKPREFTSRR